MNIENDESVPEVADPAMSVVEDSVAAELPPDPTDFDEPTALDEGTINDTQAYTDADTDADALVRNNDDVQSRDSRGGLRVCPEDLCRTVGQECGFQKDP